MKYITLSLGAKVQREVRVKDKVATHLVAARGGTAKVNEARRFNEKNKSNPVHLVTPDWLWCCAERWEKAEEAIFPLYKSAQARDLLRNGRTLQQMLFYKISSQGRPLSVVELLNFSSLWVNITLVRALQI